MSGLELSRRFYEQVVGPLLGGRPHAAALLGDGSEILGYDDVSPDHDFGPRLQLFRPADSLAGGSLDDELAALLPDEFEGFRVAYQDSDAFGGAVRHHVEVTTAAEFFRARLGVDPADGMGLADWLLAPTQVLGTLTAGAVFHDPGGELALRRDRLRWYPDDVWRYALAAAWLRIEQEEPIRRRGAFTPATSGWWGPSGTRSRSRRRSPIRRWVRCSGGSDIGGAGRSAASPAPSTRPSTRPTCWRVRTAAAPPPRCWASDVGPHLMLGLTWRWARAARRPAVRSRAARAAHCAR
jgi:hypothetical protein